ncbi:MAG TPA: ABC transporter ATP-binding protein [Arachnia sp.]|nr:ABC transporter ATP-binding protein [Arachnia sp.]HMT84722.1 ABC transporter ATP-binding protein [Arachnia sp.]
MTPHTPSPDAPALVASKIVAGYRSRARTVREVVLHEVSLTVREGELLAILGPSGCGKSTLLRVIAGLHPADDGRIELGGRVVVDGSRGLAPERRGVGLVPQDSALFPHRDVAANVEFGLLSRGNGRRRPDRAARRRRVQELLEVVGLSDFARRFPDELSGGERQRVALARALAPGPAIVLLDEAFGALDASLRVQLRTDVREILRRTAATAILVTHDQTEALSMADRIAIMRAGRIVQTGSPSDLYRAPVDAWTAGFLGECSILRGISDGRRAHCALGSPEVAPLPDDAPPPAGDVQLVVRPEHLRVAGSPTGAASTPVTVRAMEYRGPSTLYHLRVAESGEALMALAPGDARFPVGSRLHASLRGPVHAIPR